MNDEFVLVWFDDTGVLVDSDGNELIGSDDDGFEIANQGENVAVLFDESGELVDSDGDQLVDSDGDIFGFAEGQTVATFTINI